MEVNELCTKSDLLKVKQELMTALKETLNEVGNKSKGWLKSNEVMEMLGISSSGLQNLRVQGKIPYSKIGGILYYPYNDILNILEKNKRNIV